MCVDTKHTYTLVVVWCGMGVGGGCHECSHRLSRGMVRTDKQTGATMLLNQTCLQNTNKTAVYDAENEH